jgi:hypothetical protein
VKLKKEDQKLALDSKVGLLQEIGRASLAASNGRVWPRLLKNPVERIVAT